MKRIVRTCVTLALITCAGLGGVFGPGSAMWDGQVTRAENIVITTSGIMSPPTMNGIISPGEWDHADWMEQFYLNVNNTPDSEGKANVDGNNYIYVGEGSTTFYVGLDLCSDQSNNTKDEWVSLFLNTGDEEFNGADTWCDLRNQGTEVLSYDVEKNETLDMYTSSHMISSPGFPGTGQARVMDGTLVSGNATSLATGDGNALVIDSVDNKTRVDFGVNLRNDLFMGPFYEILRIQKCDVSIMLAVNTSVTGYDLVYWYPNGTMNPSDPDQAYVFPTSTEYYTQMLSYGIGNLSADYCMNFSLVGLNDAPYSVSIREISFSFTMNFTDSRFPTMPTFSTIKSYAIKKSFGASPNCVVNHRMFEIAIPKSEINGYNSSKDIGIMVGGYGTAAFDDQAFWSWPCGSIRDFSYWGAYRYRSMRGLALPVANFTTNGTTIAAGDFVQFNFTGSQGDAPANISWGFGDGGTSDVKDPVHQYTSDGTYRVQLTVTDKNGDEDTMTRLACIQVGSDPIPNVDFVANVTRILEGCAVQFNYTGTDGNGISSYLWEFNDGTYATTENVSHVFPYYGSFSITLWVNDTDGDEDTLCKYGYIVADQDTIPSPSIDAYYTQIVTGATAYFSVAGSVENGIAECQWDFGDGSANDTNQQPNHAYVAPGNYTVKLTVTDTDSDVGTVTRVDYIQVQDDIAPVANFTWAPVSSIAGQEVNFTFTGQLGNFHNYFYWQYGDGDAEWADAATSHVYTAAGNHTIYLTVSDRDGDYADKMLVITVLQDLLPVASFNADLTSISEGASIQFNYAGTAGNGIASYQWDFGDGSANATIATPSHVFSHAGAYTVKLTVTDVDGDVSTYAITVTATAPSSVGVPVDGLFAAITLVSIVACVIRLRSRFRDSRVE